MAACVQVIALTGVHVKARTSEGPTPSLLGMHIVPFISDLLTYLEGTLNYPKNQVLKITPQALPIFGAPTTALNCLQVVEEIVSNVGVIEKLTNFTHKDANGRDWGLNVRQRAKELIFLVTDTERIRSERQKVRQAFMPEVGCFSSNISCIEQPTSAMLIKIH